MKYNATVPKEVALKWCIAVMNNAMCLFVAPHTDLQKENK
jgi:hypothetical protein